MAATEKYNQIRGEILSRVASVKDAGGEIDKEKYSSIVDEVIATFRDDIDDLKGNVGRLAGQIKKDWNRIKQAMKEGTTNEG